MVLRYENPKIFTTTTLLQNIHFIQSINQASEIDFVLLIKMLCHKIQITCYSKQNLISTPCLFKYLKAVSRNDGDED